ncbi:MAG: DUF4143 domain-containing protein [Coriobacteriales bacterium]|nr:DUF4143 domain-containing protein [Coriobacteriales bacterium]
MRYQSRIIDQELEMQLRAAGAVLVRGPKGCGKTETGRYHCKSEVDIDESPAIMTAMQSDPVLLLAGKVPRLIDEWQEQPVLWNTVRHEVDRRQEKGQFVLTGSSNPEETAKLHSGAGRFGVVRMQTMSWFERGWSSGEVSLKNLLAGDSATSGEVPVDVQSIARRMVIGGLPVNLGLDEDAASLNMENYFDLLCEVDMSRVSNRRRDPVKVRRTLQSIARNVATEAPVSRIVADIGEENGTAGEKTVREYLDALERLMIIEDLPAWKPHIRTRARLRGVRKRHLADPSLAAAALALNSGHLVKDLEYLGFLFESQAIHDLRVYASALRGKVFHYRDSNGVEADAIVELRDGSWAAFEVKLGIGGAEDGARSLLKVRDTVDTSKVGNPLALVVITGSGIAHRRKDGVYVIPLATLKP